MEAELDGILGILSNSVQFRKLVELDKCRLGLACRIMIEFPESDGIDSGVETDSAMFNIVE